HSQLRKNAAGAQGMKEALKGKAITALNATGLIGLYFRYLEWRLSRGRAAPPTVDAHGVPIPPLALMIRVVAHADWEMFLRTGEETATALDVHATEAGLPFRACQRILDFGCGCGRVIRHLPRMTEAQIWGTDYNKSLVDWCAANLPGTYLHNQLVPPMDAPNGHFDVLYALSVLTHLRAETQRAWLGEYRRLLRPGGLALVSFHEETQPGFPDTQEARNAILNDGIYLFNDMAEGSNLIATFQTRAHLSALAAEHFEVVDIKSMAQSNVGQSLAVLRAV
ncbi:MAG: methyltransferase domain-containing protein, partial [Pseudomonadota bacterium]